ncbi:O-antigen ligase family protein [Sphingomonas fennica]|nr:O-antigen ligase family protein [Sphingomonas fennica]
MLHDLIKLAYMLFASLGALAFLHVCLKGKELQAVIPQVAIVCAAVLSILVLSPNLILTSVALFFIVPVLCRRPEHLGGMMLISMLLVPEMHTHLTVAGVWLFPWGPSHTIGLGALMMLFVQGKRAKPARLSDIVALLLVAYFVVGQARDTSFTNVLRVTTQQLLDLYLPYYVVTRSLRTESDFRTFIVYLLSAGMVLSALVALESVTGWVVFRETLSRYGLDAQWFRVKWRHGFLRAAGPFLEATAMAFGLSFFAMVAWQFRSFFQNNLSRLAVFGAIFVGVTACQSRNAHLGLAVAIIASEAFRRFAKPATAKALLVFAVMLIAVPTTLFLNESPQSTKTGSDTEDTAAYRVRLFHRGLEEIAKHPLIGTNQDEFTSHMEDMRQGERIIDFVNSYIYVALVSGVIGLVMFIGALAAIPVIAVRFATRVRTPQMHEAMGYYFAMALAVLQMLLFTFFGGRNSFITEMTIATVIYAGKLNLGAGAALPRPARPRGSLAAMLRGPDPNWRRSAGD